MNDPEPEKKARHRRVGRPPQTRDKDGMTLCFDDFRVEADELDEDLTIDGFRVSQLGGGW